MTNLIECCQQDFGKTRNGQIWGRISRKVDFFVRLGLYFFLYHVDQSPIAFWYGILLYLVKSILVI